MSKRSIRDFDLAGKRVMIRVDFNVPVMNGSVGDDTRIRASLPTLRHAIDRGATVVLVSHLGRPKGQPRAKLSLKPIAVHLSKLLDLPVDFATDCLGDPARDAVGKANPGEVVLLENLRFHPEEEQNDPTFAAELAAFTDVYINDAFGTAHRAHASTVGIVKHVANAGVGMLMADEVDHLGALLTHPSRPFIAILGGSKVSGKLDVIENLLERVDTLLIGGAMAYTFFKAQSLPIGTSLVEPELLDATDRIVRRAQECGVQLRLPSDHIVAERIEVGATCETITVSDAIIGERIGIDIGPRTRSAYASDIRSAQTVMWNGPMGVFEIDEFAEGTMAVAHAVAESPATSVVGGGDSIAAVTKAGVIDQITHISTGGGASLEFLAGRILPGIDALPDL